MSRSLHSCVTASAVNKSRRFSLMRPASTPNFPSVAIARCRPVQRRRGAALPLVPQWEEQSGLGVGLAATPVVGPAAVPAAAGVGAYVGSLAGALGTMDAAPADSAPYAEVHAEVRHAGVMVAVHAPEARQRAIALEVLQVYGAQDMETADGEWRDGAWVDFDPIAPPGAEPGGPLSAARPQRIRK